MLSSIAALQLLALAQVAEPKLVTPADPPPADATEISSIAGGPASSAPAAAPAPEPGAKISAPAAPEPPRIPSLLSAETLRGASALFAWAGWSSLGVAYGAGVSSQDDVGALLDFDWATTEWRLGGFYRRHLGKTGTWDVAGRLTLSWYADSGGTWIYSDNHYDRGVELGPSLVLSTRAGAGVLSLSGEIPMTVTVHYGGGFLFVPKAAASYELPLLKDVTVGARAALGYRAGAGDAPIRSGHGVIEFLVLASYQIL